MSVYIQLPDGFDVERFKNIMSKMMRYQSVYERPLNSTSSSALSTSTKPDGVINRKKKIMRDATIKQAPVTPEPVIEPNPVSVPVKPEQPKKKPLFNIPRTA